MASIFKLPKLRKGNIHRVNDLGETKLFEAVKKGRLKSVQKLVKSGADVNHRNYNGQAPLHVAAIRGLLDIVDYLIRVGASLDCLDISGSSPMAAPIQNVAGWLDLESFPSNLAQRHKAVILRLIEAGASLDTVNLAGETALNVAINCHGFLLKDFYIPTLLVKHGCDVNCVKRQAKSKVSALAVACKPIMKKGNTTKYYCNPDFLSLLLEAGVTPEPWLLKAFASVRRKEDIQTDLKTVIDIIIHNSSEPHSLKQSCRISIRKTLQHKLYWKIGQLPIATEMKDYLKL